MAPHPVRSHMFGLKESRSFAATGQCPDIQKKTHCLETFSLWRSERDSQLVHWTFTEIKNFAEGSSLAAAARVISEQTVQ